MTLDDFRKSLTATEPSPGLTRALAGLWWDAKGDWKRAHDPLSRTKASTDHGFTPIFIEKRATRAMPPIGTAAQASPFAANHSMRSG